MLRFSKLLVFALFAAGGILTSTPAFSASSKSEKKLTPSEVLKKSKASDWRMVDPEDMLYVRLESGMVIIELNPEFAASHVKNIKRLARIGYWDGLPIQRSHDNFVVSWGDPGENKKPTQANGFQKRIAKNLKPEFTRSIHKPEGISLLSDDDVYGENFSFHKGIVIDWSKDKIAGWPLLCYGTVGVTRGNGSLLYVVTGHSPGNHHRNIKVVGQVVEGVEKLSFLPRGNKKMGFKAKASDLPKIISVKVGADLPKSKQVALEILKSSSPIFKAYTKARRNLSEKRFEHLASRIEVCNSLPPSRKKK